MEIFINIGCPIYNMERRRVVDLKGFLSFQILHELKRKRLCGDELAEIIGKKKSSMKLTPGTIYPALKNLRRNKLVTHKRSGRKKIYTLTPQGVKEYLAAKKLFKRIFKHILKS